MKITHSQALLVVESIEMDEVNEAITHFLDLYQQEPERISIQGSAITIGCHPVQRIDFLVPVPVYDVHHDALQIEHANKRCWVRPAEGVWELLILEHFLPVEFEYEPTLQTSLRRPQLDKKTRNLVVVLLDEIAIGSEYIYSITQTQSDETGVRCVLLFFEDRRTATMQITASSLGEREHAQQSWKLEDEEEGMQGLLFTDEHC